MRKIKLNFNATEPQFIGKLPSCIIEFFHIPANSNEVYVYPGFFTHLKRRGHWRDFLKYQKEVPDIIRNPDYIGQNPREPFSIELYKVINRVTMIVPIKMNHEQTLFVGSFYLVPHGREKVAFRLENGRIHPLSFYEKMACFQVDDSTMRVSEQ